MKTIRSKDGKVVALLEHKRLFTVKLSGPPVGPKVGPSVFKENMLYSVSVTWPESERQRWNDFKAQRDRLTKRMRIDSDLILDPPKEKSEMALDDNEKKWLKENFGGEYRFMQMHGLKIYDEEDRREGRAILRGFMAVDKKYKK